MISRIVVDLLIPKKRERDKETFSIVHLNFRYRNAHEIVNTLEMYSYTQSTS